MKSQLFSTARKDSSGIYEVRQQKSPTHNYIGVQNIPENVGSSYDMINNLQINTQSGGDVGYMNSSQKIPSIKRGIDESNQYDLSPQSPNDLTSDTRRRGYAQELQRSAD